MSVFAIMPVGDGPAIAGALGRIVRADGGDGSAMWGVAGWIILALGSVLLVWACTERREETYRRVLATALTYSVFVALGLAVSIAPSGLSLTSGVGQTVPRLAGSALLFGVGLCLGLLSSLIVELRRHLGSTTSLRIDGHRTAALWNSVARVVASLPTLDAMLLDVAASLRAYTHGETAHVFKFSCVNNRVCRIGSTSAQTPHTATFPERRTEYGRMLSRVAAITANSPGVMVTVPQPNGSHILGIPLGIDGDVYAAILVEDAAVTAGNTEMAATLRAVGALVGRAVRDWQDAWLGVTDTSLTRALRTELPALSEVATLERGLPIIARMIRPALDVDYISVAVLDSGFCHEDRVSMLLGDDQIVESRRCWPVANRSMQRALTMRRAVLTPDLGNADIGADDGDAPWESRLGMRSRAIVPFAINTDVSGALTVAHHAQAHFGVYETARLETIANVVAIWLAGTMQKRAAERLAEVQQFAARLTESPAEWLDDRTILQEAMQRLQVSGMRLYRLDATVGALAEVASVGRIERFKPFRNLDLNVLPWHRWALDSGRPLCIDQSDPESLMDAREAAAAMDQAMKTGCVIPITDDGEQLGILDVIEVREPHRRALDQTDHNLLTVLGRAFAVRWGSVDRAAASSSTLQVAATEGAELRDLRRDVVSPLTSIIGSVDLIRHRQPGLAPDTIRFLNTIEQAAGRIGDSTRRLAPEVERPMNRRTVDRVDSHIGVRDQNGGQSRFPGIERPMSVRGDLMTSSVTVDFPEPTV